MFLTKAQYKLPVQTTQVLQDQLVMNSSEIVLFYSDNVQLWNLDTQKRLFRSQQSESIWFWSVAVSIGKTSFAFVCLQNLEPYLGIYNFQGNKLVKLCDLPKDQANFATTFYFEQTGFIGVQQRSSQHKLLIWNGKQLKEIILDGNSSIEKYNKNSVVFFNICSEASQFSIYDGKQIKQYPFVNEPKMTIVTIQQFSPTQAAIAVVNGKQTHTYIYSLNSKTMYKYDTLNFEIDNFVKLSSQNWIAVATTEDQGNSTIKVQRIFRQPPDTQLKVQNINRWIRVWNQHIPMVTFSHDHKYQEQQLCGIEVVRCKFKKSMYIAALELEGIVQAFGKQIVKQVINNLNV